MNIAQRPFPPIPANPPVRSFDTWSYLPTPPSFSRGRLIVTLRRVLRRLRRYCSKLQDLLRREVKFRWRHGEPPPEAMVCATTSARFVFRTGTILLRLLRSGRQVHIATLASVQIACFVLGTRTRNSGIGLQRLFSRRVFSSAKPCGSG